MHEDFYDRYAELEERVAGLPNGGRVTEYSAGAVSGPNATNYPGSLPRPTEQRAPKPPASDSTKYPDLIVPPQG